MLPIEEYQRSRTPSPPSSEHLTNSDHEENHSSPAAAGQSGTPQLPRRAQSGGTGWEERVSHSLLPALRGIDNAPGASPPFSSPAQRYLSDRVPPTPAGIGSTTPSPSLMGSASASPHLPRSSLSLPPSMAAETLNIAAVEKGAVAAPVALSPKRSGAPPPLRKEGSSSRRGSSGSSFQRERTVLFTWGQNGSGQLGNGDYSTRILPQAVDYFRSATLAAVKCGSSTTLAVDAEGKVFAWGKGHDGALGTGERASALKPRLVEGLLRYKISKMAIRGAHVLALTERAFWAWGRNEDGQLGTRTGSGDAPQRPREFTHSATPERVAGLMGVTVTHIACGRGHSIAIDAAGNLHTWGCNDDGSLGHGDTHSRAAPTRVAAFEGMRVVNIAWARGTRSPRRGRRALLVGLGRVRLLGHGDVGARRRRCRRRARWDQVWQGPAGVRYRHSVVLAEAPGEDGGGRVAYAWGWGQHGQLGTGRWADELSPVMVHALRHLGVLKLRLGGKHSLALCQGGRVYVWGHDGDGELGLGAQGAMCTPTLLQSLVRDDAGFTMDVLDASLGWCHTALLVSVKSDVLDARIPSPHARPRHPRHRRRPRLMVWADLEGLFGLVLGTSIQFMLMERLLTTRAASRRR